MSRFLNLLALLFLTQSFLSADNEIYVKATIVAHANTHMKTTKVESNYIHQEIYLDTNYRGLTIALSKNRYSTLPSSVMLGSHQLTNSPIALSDKTYELPTKIGNLTISRDQNLKSLAITIAVT